ncbi:MAG: hypothetical protein HZA22_11610 [Nitrospirae bacterium]|nr:hypothetical protein [Nitrospirota bacterium]
MRKSFMGFAAVGVAAMLACALGAPPPACASPGDILWESEYSSEPGQDSDIARGIALDPKGGLLVAGSRITKDGNYDYLTLKFAPDGGYAWVRAYDGTWYDAGRAVASDNTGNAVVAGASYNLANPRDTYSGSYYTDYHVVKYSPEGEPLFEMTASGFMRNNVPASVAVDDQGGIYVTGSAKNAPDTQTLYYTVKFDPAGQLLWERAEDWIDEAAATGIAVDPDGNTVITGYEKDPRSETYDVRTLRYPPDGYRAMMDVTYNNLYEDEKAWAVAVDGEGCIVIAGESSQAGGQALVLKYSPDGDLLWVQRYGGTAHENHANAVAVDRYGRIYAAGRVADADGEGDFLLLVYGPDGTLMGDFVYPAEGDAGAEGVVVEPDGDVVITGTVAPAREPGVIRTMRVEGYPSPFARELDPRELLDVGSRLSLSGLPRPMVRDVSLRAYRLDPEDSYSAVKFVAYPSTLPGDYEYRFYTYGVDTVHDWEPMTDYTGSNAWTYTPDGKRGGPGRVMVTVRAKGSGLPYEAKAVMEIGPGW